MARPSKRQLACRNANNVKRQKAKERRETGGLALGSSQTRDTDGETLVPNRPNDGIEDEEDCEDEEEAELEQGEDDTEQRPKEDLSVAPKAFTTPKSAAAPPAPPKPAPVAPPKTYLSGPSFQCPPGFTYSSPSSSSNFLSGPPSSAASPQYMTHAPPNSQSNAPLPPLRGLLPQHQNYLPAPLPPQHDALLALEPVAPPPKAVPEVSNYNFISGKPVCRQTLWRRKKRAEAAALNAVPEPPEPDPVRQHREEMAEAVEKWPRVPTAKLKEDILDAAINDMEKLLKSKVRRPKGQDLNRHQQVLHFMNIQRMNRAGTPRMDLALTVANTYRKGREVADRIVRHEKEWIKRRIIPAGGQGKNAKVPSMLEDDGTLRCIRAHIEAMGEKLTAAGLAVAVSAYWQSENSYGDNMVAEAEENGSPPPDAETRKRKLTLSSRTASTWLGKLGYVFEDGVYRHKGVQQIIAPPQEGGAGGYL